MEKRQNAHKISVEFTAPEQGEIPIQKRELKALLSNVVGWQNIRRLVFPHEGQPVGTK